MTCTAHQALSAARARPYCEICGRPNDGHFQAAHVLTRGMGGGSEVSHPWNLLGLCADCHQRQHTEGVSGILFGLVARRVGRPVEQIKQVVRELRKQ